MIDIKWTFELLLYGYSIWILMRPLKRTTDYSNEFYIIRIWSLRYACYETTMSSTAITSTIILISDTARWSNQSYLVNTLHYTAWYVPRGNFGNAYVLRPVVWPILYRWGCRIERGLLTYNYIDSAYLYTSSDEKCEDCSIDIVWIIIFIFEVSTGYKFFHSDRIFLLDRMDNFI